ncbi:helix-turn-helix domain-containing protein [Nitrococcus mobilis]|uniref:Helix-turn-helix motif n=1 Tax=Nitrococcus mobilis Nb-231 TaxID=314278 RepID=A4BU77_9GAMM|nr:hypothetical protein [Nitrococcus mobilis]EAR20751.1 Helix-turn-helix motif [Nitrococcus mobilis Nb-231]
MMSIRIEDLEETDFTDVVEAGGEPIAPTSPGDILHHEFLEPLDINVNAPAHELYVTTDTALRLARYFETTPQLWLGLQEQYDLEIARPKRDEQIEQETAPQIAAH